MAINNNIRLHRPQRPILPALLRRPQTPARLLDQRLLHHLVPKAPLPGGSIPPTKTAEKSEARSQPPIARPSLISGSASMSVESNIVYENSCFIPTSDDPSPSVPSSARPSLTVEGALPTMESNSVMCFIPTSETSPSLVSTRLNLASGGDSPTVELNTIVTSITPPLSSLTTLANTAEAVTFTRLPQPTPSPSPPSPSPPPTISSSPSPPPMNSDTSSTSSSTPSPPLFINDGVFVYVPPSSRRPSLAITNSETTTQIQMIKELDNPTTPTDPQSSGQVPTVSPIPTVATHYAFTATPIPPSNRCTTCIASVKSNRSTIAACALVAILIIAAVALGLFYSRKN